MRYLSGLLLLVGVAHAEAPPAPKMPTEVQSTEGVAIIACETAGTEVRWFFPDGGLKLGEPPPLNPKRACIVYATGGPGKYRVLAWTAIDGIPSQAAECTVLVGASREPIPAVHEPAGPAENRPLLQVIVVASSAAELATVKNILDAAKPAFAAGNYPKPQAYVRGDREIPTSVVVDGKKTPRVFIMQGTKTLFAGDLPDKTGLTDLLGVYKGLN